MHSAAICGMGQKEIVRWLCTQPELCGHRITIIYLFVVQVARLGHYDDVARNASNTSFKLLAMIIGACDCDVGLEKRAQGSGTPK